MLTDHQDHASGPLIEIKGSSTITSLAFLPSGEHVVAGSEDETIKVWHVETGLQVGREIRVGGKVTVLAVSKDGRWIVGGTKDGLAIVLAATTREEVVRINAHSKEAEVYALDVSPDSRTFVTGSTDYTAVIWDIETGRELVLLGRDIWLMGAKFSPQGDRIATAAASRSFLTIRVFDSPSGDLLIVIPDSLDPFSTVAWSNDGHHLFSLYEGKIKQFDASDGSLLLEWEVDYSSRSGAFIAMPNSGKFIAYSMMRSVSLWDTSTHTQVGSVIEPTGWSIVISEDDRFLASCHERSIIIQSLQDFLPESYFDNSIIPASRDHLRDWTAGSEEDFTKWVEEQLKNCSWKQVFNAALEFKVPKSAIYQTICDVLEADDRVVEAAECFNIMIGDCIRTTKYVDKRLAWSHGFRLRCAQKLESVGDAEMESQKYDNAIDIYSIALSLHWHYTLFTKRSKAQAGKKLWDGALHDADNAIKLDSSYPWAYECKHAALHGVGRFDEAIKAYETMLSLISRSPDQEIKKIRHQYVNPSETEATIRAVVQSIIQDLPRVLIDVSTGHLHDRNKLESSFEASTSSKELISSMTTRIDRTRIEKAVADFFRYVMLSHKWDGNEPLFQMVENVSIYELEPSLTNDKLQNFCRRVRDGVRFRWAWSDTCCIDKTNHVVLQESLVSMFKWYRGSALTMVYLRGVRSPSKVGDLVNSIWNTRAWTYQEYVAAEVIQFYDENWIPYLNLPTFDDNLLLVNHKSLPAIIAEMEQAIRVGLGDRVSPELRPGLDNIREKLCLASKRQTTLVEDAAYSLFGIFSTSIPVIYGEGQSALGRLLGHILTGSGDVSILAWTGESSTYNSCMPARITVYKDLATSHLPSPLEPTEMDRFIAALRANSLDVALAVKLYDRLNDLAAPWFAANRMKLPCLTFQLGPLRTYRSGGVRVYRAMTIALGIVEIRTTENLPHSNMLYIVHPWISALLDREVPDSIGGELELPSPNADAGEEISDDDDETLLSPSSLEPPPPPPPASGGLSMDKKTRALRLLARLRQPFGALLLAVRPNGVEYRRVASDCVITVQVQENTNLAHLLDSVRVLDVL